MSSWQFLVINIVLPVVLLALNIWVRWPSSTAASAGADWVLLLIGLELATFGAIGVTGGTAFSDSPSLSLWLMLMLPIGFGLWYTVRVKVETAIFASLPADTPHFDGSGAGPKRIRASKRTITAYTWSIILPAIYAGMNGLIFLGSTAK